MYSHYQLLYSQMTNHISQEQMTMNKCKTQKQVAINVKSTNFHNSKDAAWEDAMTSPITKK